MQHAHTQFYLHFSPMIKKSYNPNSICGLKEIYPWRVMHYCLKLKEYRAYVASSVHSDKNSVNTVEQLLLNFLWKNRTHYISKSVVSNSCKNCGLNFLDYIDLHI